MVVSNPRIMLRLNLAAGTISTSTVPAAGALPTPPATKKAKSSKKSKSKSSKKSVASKPKSMGVSKSRRKTSQDRKKQEEKEWAGKTLKLVFRGEYLDEETYDMIEKWMLQLKVEEFERQEREMTVESWLECEMAEGECTCT